MKIDRIGSRGVRFTFDDEISIYLIVADRRLFLCDTHLGPESMDEVKQFLATQGWSGFELIVFNSHSDWDHIWGNCAFHGATIIGHTTCRKRMQERGEYDLKRVPMEQRKGEVAIKLPNLTFDKRLFFEDDAVEFIYAPGHTVCSAICIDHKDGVAYIGDLLERPIPYVLHYDLDAFIATLKMLKELPFGIIVTAHSGLVDNQLIDDTIGYLQALRDNQPTEQGEKAKGLHAYNRNNVLLLSYEQQIREKLGDRFDLASFMCDLGQLLGVESSELVLRRLRSVAHDELKQTLANYLDGLE